jgi:uncharacterized protein
MKVSENALQTYYNEVQSTRESSQVQLLEKNLELLEAAYHGDDEKAKNAIHAGVDVSATDERGYNAAYIAVDKGHISVLKIVIQAGINLHHVLFDVAIAGNVELFKKMLDAGVEIDIEEVLLSISSQNQILLRYASMSGRAAIAQILLDYGMEILTEDLALMPRTISANYIDRQARYDMLEGEGNIEILGRCPLEGSTGYRNAQP